MSISRKPDRRHAGMTLVELVMFIVVVGVGLAGILSVLTIGTRSSADPMIRKNMLAIAEALLEEVEMMPYTYCDPDDDNATTATDTTGCASLVETLGPEGGELRSSSAVPFDNVNDYQGAALAGPIADVSATYFAPPGYSATIQIVPEALNDIASASPPASMEALRIAVTVTHGSDSLTLEGYRARHSPNWVP